MTRPDSSTATKTIRRITVVLLMLSSCSAAAATYYRWVDAVGVTHYTSTPPKGVAAEKITSATRSAEATAATPLVTAEPDASTPAQPVASLKEPERCAQAKAHLAKLQSGRRIRTATDDGGFRYMTEEDIQEQVAIAQQAIRESC